VSNASPAETLRFAKYEGLGNDFIVVDASAPDVFDRSLARAEVVAAICDRHRGIGADGLLLAGVIHGVPFMRVLNADGSEPEMCGNGLRCVALHLARTGQLPERAETESAQTEGTQTEGTQTEGTHTLIFDTGAGPHGVTLHAVGESGVVEVQMRAPSLVPSAVPVCALAPLVDAPLEVDGHTLRVTAVSMGNPHVVTFDVLSVAERLALGPRLERDARFPEGVNVGFAQMTASDALTLHVFERGVGWTEACGTGACAAAVAAVESGRAERGRTLRVALPGGTLLVRVGAPGASVYMTGPARHVFDGTLALDVFQGTLALDVFQGSLALDARVSVGAA